LIKKIIDLLIKSKKIHNDYIKLGKTFLYAKKLRSINKQILTCLTELNFNSVKELEKPSLDLKEHIEDWISTWDKEQFIKKPKNNDVFIFYSKKRYPKEFELLLFNRIK
tara:strand:- start:1198 stop:1524 length:327 start_codon:yes stop_codon:yes gene_type:complete